MLAPSYPDPADWDAFILSHHRGHILQLSTWGTLKSEFGWTVDRIALEDEQHTIVAGTQVLLRPLPFRLGSMAYIPMGPYANTESQYTALWDAIQKRVVRQHGAAFLKLEPGIYTDSPPDFTKWGFNVSPHTIQPPRTILIDIGDEEDAILARMNQGTRRKIRQGAKKGVRYFEAKREDVARFNTIMQSTGERNDFGVHSPAYYQRAYDLFVPQNAALILAEHEGDLLAGVFVFAAGDSAWYIAGASADHKRHLMASYGAQWTAVQWARARGCQVYDMWGIPDEDESVLEAEFKTRNDGLWGVYGFKRGWGGQVVRSSETYDRVYNPLTYWSYRAALSIRQR